MSQQSFQSDAYPPAEIARKVEQLGEKKAHTGTLTLLVLATLAGAFISMGALLYTVVIIESQLGFGITRLIGGISFSLGLILVIIAGAELFTGNNLLAMAWASGRIGFREVMRNWLIVYVGNVLGCFGTVVLVFYSDIGSLNADAVSFTATKIAHGKAGLTMMEAFARGVLCNVFVCLAVWLATGARSVTDKIFAIIPPIAGFVAIGLEHSIANWFFLLFGLALNGNDPLLINGFINSIVIVSIGNIVGGTVLVAGVYWAAYLRNERKQPLS